MDRSAVVARLNPHRTRITRPILRTPLFEPDRVHPTYLLTGDETAAQGLNWRDDLGRYRLNLPREPGPRGQECPRHMDTARCPMFASFCDANMVLLAPRVCPRIICLCFKKETKAGTNLRKCPSAQAIVQRTHANLGHRATVAMASLLGGESAKQKGLSFERPFIGRGGLSERQRRRTSPESFSSNYLACVTSAGAVVDAIWSRLFFSMLTSTRPPLMRTVLPSASVFGALPMPTTKIR